MTVALAAAGPSDVDLVVGAELRLRGLLDQFAGSRRALRRDLLGEFAAFLDADAWEACEAFDRLARQPDAELVAVLRQARAATASLGPARSARLRRLPGGAL